MLFLLVLYVVMIGAAIWLAGKRGRRAWVWAPLSAWFPPFLLLLALLPSKARALPGASSRTPAPTA